MVSTKLKRTVFNGSSKFGYNLLPTGKQFFPLSGLFTIGSTQYGIESLRHIGVFDDFLYDISFPAHTVLLLVYNTEDKGLPFPGSDFFELITAYQTPPDA